MLTQQLQEPSTESAQEDKIKTKYSYKHKQKVKTKLNVVHIITLHSLL
jgi:hypothetical protein